MKRLLLLLFVIAIKMAVVAQTTFLPMVVEGRTWNVVTINPADPSETNNSYYDILGRRGKVWNRISYVIEGDTVIGGVTYKRLLSDGKFVCGLREEEGRVYDSEALVYDFNAQPGDVIKNTIDESIWMQVGQMRQMSFNGQIRRCLDMYSYYYIGDPEEGEEREIMGGYKVADYWIEGIGCTGYPHNPFWRDVIGNYPLLLSCYDGEECIFNIEDLNGIVTAIKDIPEAVHRRSVDSDTPVFNLAGQRVNPSYKGIVIQNGKKKLVK